MQLQPFAIQGVQHERRLDGAADTQHLLAALGGGGVHRAAALKAAFLVGRVDLFERPAKLDLRADVLGVRWRIGRWRQAGSA